MPNAVGCRLRRERICHWWRSRNERFPIVLGDPIHLRYFAGFHVDAINLNADYGGLLAIADDASATLIHDNRTAAFAATAHVETRRPIPWYDGKSPGQGCRRIRPWSILGEFGGQVHDCAGTATADALYSAVSSMRRCKDADEIETLRHCMRATEAGHDWARRNIRSGMTELDVYLGVAAECCRSAGKPVVVYGDFAVSPGPARRGGPPTDQVLRNGDTFILDYSVVIDGYRSDFTNTLVVGGSPTSDQSRLMRLCREAMAAGESLLRAGSACRSVDAAVRQVFATEGMDSAFPHHSGHGLGLSHPEAPFFVRHADEVLRDGDVVTLEPGLYLENVGGIRIEHNYRITADGFERLSGHEITLT